MSGYNPKKIPVIELFGPTFQGEGALCGVQTYFLRTGLCDYDCVFCDSRHAVDPHQVRAIAKWQTQAEIEEDFWKLVAGQAATAVAPWMTLTGGNPCIHDLTYLVEALQTRGIKINVETQGTICPPWLPKVDLVTISPKSPGMGEKFEEDKFRDMLRKCMLQTQIAVKIVVFNTVDLEFAHLVFSIVEEEELAYNTEMNDNVQLGRFLSLGNWMPPQHANLEKVSISFGRGDRQGVDDEIRRRLLYQFRSLCEDILQDNRFRKVTFLPQLHVLTWANLQKV
jgi:7-carboxy-7-deazaguanine synthase